MVSSLFAAPLFLLFPVFAHPSSSHVLESRAASIKQIVGAWQFKGCYEDFGPRILSFRFDVPQGNSAEACTALCRSKGYGLAGMEYGSECWCDNYLPYGALKSDSDCNMICPGDVNELCGAGNRMTIYQDSTATPPSPDTCITWRDSFSFGNNDLTAVPKSGTGPVTKLYAIPTNPFTDWVYYTIISTCPEGCPYTDYDNFGVVDGVMSPYNGFPIAPNVGDSQAFKYTIPLLTGGYNGFCAKPNPISPNGPFIGSPLLSVSGHTDLWGLCSNSTAGGRLDIVYSPIINHPHYTKSDCQDVYIQMSK